LGSGLDVAGIVSKLMTIESQPATQLYAREGSYQAKISAYGTLQSVLSTLQSAAQTLASPQTYHGTAAGSSDSTVLTASVSGTAVPGSYNVAVTSLAQAQILASASADPTTHLAYGYTTSSNFNSGTLSLTVGGTTTSIAVDATNNTLPGIAQAINNANIGVSASVVNDGTATRLVINAANSGLANTVSLKVSEDNLITGQASLTALASNMTTVQPAADAAFSVNGLAITRSSNSVSDIIPGVTFKLLKAGTTGSPATSMVTVGADTTDAVTAVSTFVTAYNAVFGSIHDLTAYDAQNSAASVLTGDSTARTLKSELSAAIFQNVSGVTGLTSLNDIGVSVQKDGTLAFNSAKLQSALADPSKDVSALFTQTGSASNGIGVNFNNLLTSVVGTGGLLPTAQDSANRSIKDIANQITTWNTRLALVRQRYMDEFNALDAMLSSMQATSTYLTQQLANLPGISGTSKSG
jgi:flagellar hook-associated protein 2